MELEELLNNIINKTNYRKPPYTIISNASNEQELYNMSESYSVLYEKIEDDNFTIFHTSPYFTSGVVRKKDELPILNNRPLHKHNYLEVMFVLNGSLIQRIENKKFNYSKGQCIIMNRNIRHTEEFSSNFSAFFVSLSNSFLKNVISQSTITMEKKHLYTKSKIHQMILDETLNVDNKKEYIDFVPIAPLQSYYPSFEKLFSLLVDEISNNLTGSELVISGYVNRLFAMLENPNTFQSIQKSEKGGNAEHLFVEITHYLEANKGRVNRKELETALNYSADYLNRIVKLYANMSLLDYGKIFLLKEAKSLLIYSNLSVSEIINRLGFANRTYFYKLFQEETSLSPIEYRNKHRYE